MEYLLPLTEHLIRPCRPEDLSSLVILCGKHAAHERAPYNPAGKDTLLLDALFGDGSEPCGDRSQLSSPAPKLHCLVVAADRNLIGYATYTFDFSTWEARPFLYMVCLFLEEA